MYYPPCFGLPVQDTDIVEPHLLISSPTEHYHLICVLVEVESVVRPGFRRLTRGDDFLPVILSDVVGPEVIEILASLEGTSISSKHDDL